MYELMHAFARGKLATLLRSRLDPMINNLPSATERKSARRNARAYHVHIL